MSFDLFPASELGAIDRQVEDLVREAVNQHELLRSAERIGELIERRVELSEPVGFARIEELLGLRIPA